MAAVDNLPSFYCLFGSLDTKYLMVLLLLDGELVKMTDIISENELELENLIRILD